LKCENLKLRLLRAPNTVFITTRKRPSLQRPRKTDVEPQMYRRNYGWATVPPTTAAREAFTALRSIGVSACLVGGLACKLYGNIREANDVDILCLTNDWDQEALKRALVRRNSNFFLVPSRDPTATYQVLWYRGAMNSKIKVDILLPGIMNIPAISPSLIVHKEGLPVAPLSLVFLLKLQAWSQHGASSETRFRLKQPTDEADIQQLLPILERDRIKPDKDVSLPSSFRKAAVERVQEYVRRRPNSAETWRRIGYKVAQPPTYHSLYYLYD